MDYKGLVFQIYNPIPTPRSITAMYLTEMTAKAVVEQFYEHSLVLSIFVQQRKGQLSIFAHHY